MKGSHAVSLLFVLSAATLFAADAPVEQAMAEQVDARLADVWTREQVSPAVPATDAEFLRRAWLDLCGVIPPLNDEDGLCGVRDFLASGDDDKRERLIEKLLAKPSHATHFATVWKNVMLPADANVQRFGGDAGFLSWLRGQFADNRAYDEVVTDILLAQGTGQTGPALFYTALELKPEELAAGTSRIFLGTQIQCAQCHNHPFDHWTRTDFWGYAAFFARLQRPAQRQGVAFQVNDAANGEVKIPETDEIVSPTFLGGIASTDVNGRTRRQRLAEWMTSAENPFFAKATVNRVWALMFGRGIVDPVDDIGKHNPPSHPELLDELSAYFVATNFDVNRLIRTLARTRAYQLSSRSSSDSPQRPELISRMAIKSLSAEQIYDCLLEATRRREQVHPQGVFFGGRSFDANRQAFLAKFRAPTQETTSYEAGIPQALTLMNGSLVREATDLGRSDILIALDAPFFTDEKRIETLFLSTLSRHSTKLEREKFVDYVANPPPDTNRREALGDILWALLNSGEFILNH